MAANIMRVESINKVKSETSNIVKESCEYVVSILKKEMLCLLEQMGEYRKQLAQKDLDLGKCCKKFKEQEQKICELAEFYSDAKISTGYKKAEISHYNQAEEGYIPLEQRLVRYLNDVEQ